MLNFRTLSWINTTRGKDFYLSDWLLSTFAKCSSPSPPTSVDLCRIGLSFHAAILISSFAFIVFWVLQWRSVENLASFFADGVCSLLNHHLKVSRIFVMFFLPLSFVVEPSLNLIQFQETVDVLPPLSICLITATSSSKKLYLVRSSLFCWPYCRCVPLVVKQCTYKRFQGSNLS